MNRLFPISAIGAMFAALLGGGARAASDVGGAPLMRKPAGSNTARKAAQEAANRRIADAELKRQRRRERNLRGHA